LGEALEKPGVLLYLTKVHIILFKKNAIKMNM